MKGGSGSQVAWIAGAPKTDEQQTAGARIKRDVVVLVLKTLVQLQAQEKARCLKGNVAWEEDLSAMRTTENRDR